MPDDLVLNLTAVPYWLATLDLNDVGSPSGRRRLADFQHHCAQALEPHGLTLQDKDVERRRRAMDLLYRYVATTWPGGVEGALEDLIGEKPRIIRWKAPE